MNDLFNLSPYELMFVWIITVPVAMPFILIYKRQIKKINDLYPAVAFGVNKSNTMKLQLWLPISGLGRDVNGSLILARLCVTVWNILIIQLGIIFFGDIVPKFFK
jgi:hypothetical protein